MRFAKDRSSAKSKKHIAVSPDVGWELDLDQGQKLTAES